MDLQKSQDFSQNPSKYRSLLDVGMTGVQHTIAEKGAGDGRRVCLCPKDVCFLLKPWGAFEHLQQKSSGDRFILWDTYSGCHGEWIGGVGEGEGGVMESPETASAED